MSEARRVWITEVHNFGGFFGGDTVTLSAVPWPEGEEDSLTIDEKALTNITARHTLEAEMLLDLDMAGDRVDHARLVAARSREALDAALGDAPSTSRLDGPRIRAFHCARCDLWVVGPPQGDDNALRCTICDTPLAS